MRHDSNSTRPNAAADDTVPRNVVLDGARITLDQLDDLLGRRIKVEISDEIRKRIDTSCASVRRIASRSTAAYGINTGFGYLCSQHIGPDRLEQLQTNLILSHAVGVGDPVSQEVVRWMLWFKLHALTHGVSGVSLDTIDHLVQMLNADLLPVVPTQGSLGASGDLAPLAHLVLPLIGEGCVTVNGNSCPAAEALKAAGIEPITLGPKEGLALINGTQFMSAYAAIIAVRARRLVKQADLICAMSLDGYKGSVHPFDERIHALRPHRGAIETANNIRRLMVGSEILESHVDCDRVQDPYSLRCAAHVHGASRDALRHVGEVVETEINSVTDNPVIFGDDDVISGGLFHGQPLAITLDYLAIALAELASISERRTYLLIDGARDLPAALIPDAGINSGFMICHYTAAALVSENKGLCTPSSVDSIPTSHDQEDHVSMGARSAVKCLQVLENAETVLAIEQLCAAQALDFRAPLRGGVGPRTAHDEIRKTISHAENDRLFGKDIQSSLAVLRSRNVLRAVERKVGALD